MTLSPTLTFYISRQFFLSFMLIFLIFVGTSFLFDAVELLRRASGKEAATFGLLAEMAVLRLPFVAQKVLPFAALVGGILTFTRLTRTHELVVARAAGVSVWQFLLPAILVTLLVGAFVVTVFNPFSAALIGRYEQMEVRYLQGKDSLLALSSSGVWLRQGSPEGQEVVHAKHFNVKDVALQDVIIFRFEGDDHFVGRIDAATARLENGYWDLRDAVLTGPQQPAAFHDRYRVATSLTLNQIERSFAAPETLSFWALPGFINALEASGFSSLRHRIHWYSIMAGPLLLCAMVLVGATFSLRFTRRGGTWALIVVGLITGFLLYFVSDVVLALGLSSKLPAWLAAWAPSGIFGLIGTASLFHLEDG
jgi:lipopolysaccharide export system permease protein